MCVREISDSDNEIMMHIDMCGVKVATTCVVQRSLLHVWRKGRYHMCGAKVATVAQRCVAQRSLLHV
jgi:hypothetical protein